MGFRELMHPHRGYNADPERSTPMGQIPPFHIQFSEKSLRLRANLYRVLDPVRFRDYRKQLPQFFCIGTQKAGTTWLYGMMYRHPEIFIPHCKEIHYFNCNWLTDEEMASPKWLRVYAKHFAEAGPRLRGDCTPDYAIMMPRRIRLLRKLIPDARLILLLRNPVERAWSAATMVLCDERSLPRDHLTEEAFRKYFHSDRLIKEAGDYVNILRWWLEAFPQEQLLSLFYEDIRERPKELLTATFRHLRVSTDLDWSLFPLERRIRPFSEEPSPAMPEPIRQELREIYGPVIEAMQKRFGGPTLKWS